jgi:hypothetical protein
VHELFRRFTLLYGAQRCASLYDAGEFEATVAAWCGALAKFQPAVVKAALEALPGEDRAWPPSLAEFLALCRQCVPAPEHRRALPVPNRTEADIGAGREQMARIKAMLGRTVKRQDPYAAPREPGSDDEPMPPRATPACTCWVGQVRQPTLCDACARMRVSVQARDERKAAA